MAGTRYRRLSGGEKQRLGLALALLGRPELLVLDEPTAGMDPAAKQATRERIADLRAAGTTILLTTHELGDVERLADRVAVLDRGRLVASGTPAELTGGGAPRLRLRLSRALDDTEAASLAAAVAAVAGGSPRGPRRRRPMAAYDVDGLGAAPEPAPRDRRRRVVRGARPAASLELQAGSASLEERYLELVRRRDRRPTAAMTADSTSAGDRRRRPGAARQRGPRWRSRSPPTRSGSGCGAARPC